MAWCMRYWTVRRREMEGPTVSMQRSKRLLASPSFVASWLTTVGGSWQWSPGQNDAVAPEQWDPASGFGALAGLVDDGEVEASYAEDLGVQAGGGGAEDIGLVEDLLDGLGFEASGVVEEILCFLACFLSCALERVWLGCSGWLGGKGRGPL